MKPKLLDLYCKAGGCSAGYVKAGFDVVGIDIDPQPRYPFKFVQSDAIEYLLKHGNNFDAIHASPPCERYSLSSIQWRKLGKEYPDLIDATRKELIKLGKPYIIENVPNSPLINPIYINGGMFGMNVHRPRLFEIHGFDIPFFLQSPLPKPVKMGRKVKAGDVIQPVGHFSGVKYAREQMGLHWMNQEEIAHAIPPAYTEFIGRYLYNHFSQPPD